MVRITINDKEYTVAGNKTVLEAARLHNVYIPTLCNHPKLSPSGGCRLCVVEIKGIPRPVASCTTPVTDGMVVTTSTPQLEELRKLVLELIISDHPNDCMVCEATGNCALQEHTMCAGSIIPANGVSIQSATAIPSSSGIWRSASSADGA
jgi:NADH dehydrogenase/NADH:ubiquinone oxidoreductase subunit G